MSFYNQFGSQSVGTFDGAPVGTFDSKYVRDGMTFINKELEKLDNKIQEPLASTWWPRDIPVRTGGGFLENVSSIYVDYGTTGAMEDSLIGDQTNNIPVMQVDYGKESWKTYIWGHYLDIGYVFKEKMMQIGRNLEETMNKGIRLFYDKSLDKNVYTGLAKYGGTGLLNDATVTRYSAAANAEGKTSWKDKTADEVLSDINNAIRFTWEQSEHDLSAMANHVLIPAEQYADLVLRKVGVTGDKSILTYVKENNIASQQGRELSIHPMPMCKGIGTGATDRMVAYCNDVDKIRMDITVPLRRLPTEAANLRFRTPFISQFSQVQILYPTTICYVDGI